MRFVVIIVVALASLGLAAFGVVSAQKNASSNPERATVRLASNANTVPARGPIHQLAEAQASEMPAPAAASAKPGAQAAPAEPAPQPRVAQATTPQNAPAAPPPPQSAAAAPNAPAQKTATNANAASPPANNIAACDKPGGMGLARIVEIDTTGGPGFGFEHFKQYDFLRDKEVVLTFDDGPWPENTPAVLKALADHCLKATFFEIGQHATWHPEIARQVAEAGHTIGTHTWSHKDLARNPYASDLELAKQEIEMGVSAVHAAVGSATAPFFRFPSLQHPPQLMSYLGERNIAVFSTDIDSFDFKMHKPEQVVQSVMTKLQKHGKGIILMHDFQRATAEALPELLRQLKAGGYRIVHVVPQQPLTTVPKYDDMVRQQDKLSSNNTRPAGSVIRTIGEYKGAPAPAAAATNN